MSSRWEHRYRIHPEDQPAIFDPFVEQPQGIDHKPHGLWFTPSERDWTEWCADNSPGWLKGTTLSRIEIDTSRVLLLTTTEQIQQFTLDYRASPYPGVEMRVLSRLYAIDWTRVAARYDGIEITPYNWELRLDPDHHWYYTWDVASGCIWKARSVRQWNENNSPR